jgi:hypothetical protein
MTNRLTPETAQKLLRLADDDYIDIGAATWLRLGCEFKFSPKGVSGDFDTDCEWWDRNEVREATAA